MDVITARKMIENLSRGLDPYIGRELPIQDTCSDPEVQEALTIVMGNCTVGTDDQRREKERAEKTVNRELKRQERYLRYTNSQNPWDTQAVNELLKLHNKGYNIYHIANIIKRSPAAVKAQLKKRGYKPIHKY